MRTIIPKSDKDVKAAKRALDELLKQFHGNKNEMAKQTRVSRQTVGWWFTKGFIGWKSAYALADQFNVPVTNFRPDLPLERPTAVSDKPKAPKAPKPDKPKAPKYGINDLAEVLEATPASVRAKLRKSDLEKPEGGWGWNTKRELGEVVKLLKDAPAPKRGRPKKADAEATA